MISQQTISNLLLILNRRGLPIQPNEFFPTIEAIKDLEAHNEKKVDAKEVKPKKKAAKKKKTTKKKK